MAALNIAFDIPQTPGFSVTEFRRQMNEYAKTLIDKFNLQKSNPTVSKGHKILSYKELSPEIQELVGLCKGSVSEEDIDGEVARMDVLQSEYAEK